MESELQIEVEHDNVAATSLSAVLKKQEPFLTPELSAVSYDEESSTPIMASSVDIGFNFEQTNSVIIDETRDLKKALIVESAKTLLLTAEKGRMKKNDELENDSLDEMDHLEATENRPALSDKTNSVNNKSKKSTLRYINTELRKKQSKSDFWDSTVRLLYSFNQKIKKTANTLESLNVTTPAEIYKISGKEFLFRKKKRIPKTKETEIRNEHLETPEDPIKALPETRSSTMPEFLAAVRIQRAFRRWKIQIEANKISNAFARLSSPRNRKKNKIQFYS
jgi:hypothetical protein